MRRKQRTSRIWLIPSEEFATIIRESSTMTAALKRCGLQNIGGNFKTILNRIEGDGLDITHIPRGVGSNKGRKFGGTEAVDLDKVMVEQSTYSRAALKKRLMKGGLLENKCQKCGCPPVWDGAPLVLRLDHINGVNDDARQENLRLLCPNCDSQTSTFAGRNMRGLTVWRCSSCSVAISKGSIQCIPCASRETGKAHRKIEWPSYAELVLRVAATSRLEVSRELGVSDVAVRKMMLRMSPKSATIVERIKS